MDAQTIQAIEAILKGGRYVVIEIKETIKYSPPPIVVEEGQ